MTAPFKRGQRLMLTPKSGWARHDAGIKKPCEVVYCKWWGFNRSALIFVRLPDSKEQFTVHVDDVKPV